MPCYVLALAEGEVRLVEVTADLPPVPVRVAGLPASAADAAGKASISGRSHSGRPVGSEGKRTHIRHYARAAAAPLPGRKHHTAGPRGGRARPLDLPGVTSYPHLIDAVIETNPDPSPTRNWPRPPAASCDHFLVPTSTRGPVSHGP